MIKLLEEGGDLHSFAASHLSGKPYEHFLKTLDKKNKKEKLNEYDKKLLSIRQEAKSAGFAIQFGGTGYTIANNLGITEEKGDEIYNAYFKAFPELKKYFNKVANNAYKRGYILIDRKTNRKWFFKLSNNNKHSVYKKALNYPVQGEAGAMTKYAAILCRNQIKIHYKNDEVFITALVHDEIGIECEEYTATKVAKILEQCMKKASELWYNKVHMEAKASVVNYWTH